MPINMDKSLGALKAFKFPLILNFIVTVLWREEGSGDISSYTPTRVTIQSFSITSTSQYFLVLRPPDLRRPQYEKILASRGRSIVTVVFQYSIIWWLRMLHMLFVFLPLPAPSYLYSNHGGDPLLPGGEPVWLLGLPLGPAAGGHGAASTWN